MAAAGGRAVAVAAMVAVAAALPLLACGGYAECYDYCFKDCISKDKSMRDYCSYACAEAEAEAAGAKATDAQGAATAKEAVSLPARQRRGKGRQQKLIHTMGWIGQSSSEALI
uniref:Uncharacterized protein n=1 Tax=Zea mays TaxID=4577 RepID=B6TIL1_MAIZE|nr:hypothetical protein [Zea mays]